MKEGLKHGRVEQLEAVRDKILEMGLRTLPLYREKEPPSFITLGAASSKEAAWLPPKTLAEIEADRVELEAKRQRTIAKMQRLAERIGRKPQLVLLHERRQQKRMKVWGGMLL